MLSMCVSLLAGVVYGLESKWDGLPNPPLPPPLPFFPSPHTFTQGGDGRKNGADGEKEKNGVDGEKEKNWVDGEKEKNGEGGEGGGEEEDGVGRGRIEDWDGGVW